jgi:hypothetical protein
MLSWLYASRANSGKYVSSLDSPGRGGFLAYRGMSLPGGAMPGRTAYANLRKEPSLSALRANFMKSLKVDVPSRML